MTQTALLMLAFVGVDAPSRVEVDRLIRAHEATIDSIRTLRVHVEYASKRPTFFDEGVDAKDGEYDWTLDGEDERIRMVDLHQPRTDEGDEPGHKDQMNRGDRFKALIGLDSSNPPELGEFSVARAQGVIAPRQSAPLALGQTPRVHCLWRINVGDRELGLADACRAARSVDLVAEPSEASKGRYELRLEFPEGVVRCWLDPEAGFLLGRVEHDLLAKKDRPAVHNVMEADGFRAFAGGVFFPTVVRCALTEREKTMTYRYGFEVESINEPLPADAFEMRFPDWLRVVDVGTGKFHVWGPADEPRLTFVTNQEFQDWSLPRIAEARGMNRVSLSRRLLSWPVVVSTLAIVAVVATLFVRRRRALRSA